MLFCFLGIFFFKLYPSLLSPSGLGTATRVLSFWWVVGKTKLRLVQVQIHCDSDDQLDLKIKLGSSGTPEATVTNKRREKYRHYTDSQMLTPSFIGQIVLLVFWFLDQAKNDDPALEENQACRESAKSKMQHFTILINILFFKGHNI